MTSKVRDHIQSLYDDLYIEDHPFNQYPFNPEYAHSSGSEIYLRANDFYGDIQYLERAESRQNINSATAMSLFNKLKNRTQNITVQADVHKENRPVAPPRIKEEKLDKTNRPIKENIPNDIDSYPKARGLPSDYTEFEYDATDVDERTKIDKKGKNKKSHNKDPSDQSDTDSSYKRKRTNKTKKQQTKYDTYSSD